jgi:plasmid rolling circle replication initiator protein Rep
MTNAELKKNLAIWGDSLYDDTCYKLKFELVKKVMNSKAIPDNHKMLLIEQYVKNRTTNNRIIENIRQYNAR